MYTLWLPSLLWRVAVHCLRAFVFAVSCASRDVHTVAPFPSLLWRVAEHCLHEMFLSVSCASRDVHTVAPFISLLWRVAVHCLRAFVFAVSCASRDVHTYTLPRNLHLTKLRFVLLRLWLSIPLLFPQIHSNCTQVWVASSLGLDRTA